MSQETLVSQTSGSPNPAISWFPAKLPSGYEALPFEEDSEDDSDVELSALKPASATEASPAPTPFPAPGQRNSETSPTQDGPSPQRRTTACDVLKLLAILVITGLPSTLFFSTFSWLIGGIVLCAIARVPPYDTMDVVGTLKATMAGALVISLGVGALAFLEFAVRPLSTHLRAVWDRHSTSTSTSTAYHPMMNALAIFSVCALLSALAMPLGLLMMPHLATETFGVWHALAVSATGFGVLAGGLAVLFVLDMLSHRRAR